MFILPQIDPETQGRISKPYVPMSRFFGAGFEQGEHDAGYGSASRWQELRLEDAYSSNEKDLTPEEATTKWGVGDFKFEVPVKNGVARLMNQQKRAEMNRSLLLSAGSDGFFSKRGLAGMTATMAGSMFNPLDFALSFLPVVGTVGKVKAATKIGSILERGLITDEALVKAGISAPKMVATVANAGAFMVVDQIPHLVAARQYHEDFTVKEAAMNAAMAMAFGAVIHGGVAGYSKFQERVQAAGKLHDRLSPETKVEMARQSINDLLKDQTTDISNWVKLDREQIRLKALADFDEIGARSKFRENMNLEEVRASVKEKFNLDVKSLAVRHTTEMGETKIYPGEEHARITYDNKFPGEDMTDASGKYESGFLLDNGEFVSREMARDIDGLPGSGYNHELWMGNEKMKQGRWNDVDPGTQLDTDELSYYTSVLEGDNPHASKASVLQDIFAQRQKRKADFLATHIDFINAVSKETETRIDNHITELKKDLIGKAMKQEAEAQIKAGKIMPPDEIEKHQKSSTPSEKDVTEAQKEVDALQKEVDELNKSLKGDAEAKAAEQQKDATLAWFDDVIDKLKSDPTELHDIGASLVVLSKESARAMLIIVREAYKAGKALDLAIRDALSWWADKATDHELAQGNKAHSEFINLLRGSKTSEADDFMRTIQNKKFSTQELDQYYSIAYNKFLKDLDSSAGMMQDMFPKDIGSRPHVNSKKLENKVDLFDSTSANFPKEPPTFESLNLQNPTSYWEHRVNSTGGTKEGVATRGYYLDKRKEFLELIKKEVPFATDLEIHQIEQRFIGPPERWPYLDAVLEKTTFADRPEPPMLTGWNFDGSGWKLPRKIEMEKILKDAGYVGLERPSALTARINKVVDAFPKGSNYPSVESGDLYGFLSVLADEGESFPKLSKTLTKEEKDILWTEVKLGIKLNQESELLKLSKQITEQATKLEPQKADSMFTPKQVEPALKSIDSAIDCLLKNLL